MISRTRALEYPISLFFLGCLLNWRQVFSFDLWWQMAEAREILRSGFPLRDGFTYALAGHAYIAHEWATGMAFAAIHHFFPVHGLQAFASLAFGLFSLLFYFVARRKSMSPFNAWLYSALFLTCAYHRFPIRPELFTNVCLLSLVAMDGAWRGTRDLAAHALLFAVWGNFHGEFSLGLAYLGLSFVAAPSRSGALRGISAFLGSLANPYSWKIYSVPLYYLFHQREIFSVSTEGQTIPLYLGFAVFIGLFGLAATAAGWSPRPRQALVLIAAFGFETLKVNRIFVAFAIVVFPHFCAGLQPWLDKIFEIPPRAKRAMIWAVVLAVLFARQKAIAKSSREPFDQRSLPSQAVNFLDRIGARGKIYNSYSFGGYLEWTLFPTLRPFYDGRYISTDLLHEEESARKNPAAWTAFQRRYDSDFAIIDWVWEGGINALLWPDWGEAWLLQERASPYDFLFPRSDWALIYWDDRALIFARRNASARDLIRRSEIFYTEPLSWDRTLDSIKRGKTSSRRVLAELNDVGKLAGGNWAAEMMRQQLRLTDSRR